MGKFGLVMICFGVLCVADLVFEPLLWLPLGMYSYAGAIEWMTVLQGHYYQFPLFEGIFWPATWTVLTAIRYFRNDRGLTVAERGVDELHGGRKAKSAPHARPDRNMQLGLHGLQHSGGYLRALQQTVSQGCLEH